MPNYSEDVAAVQRLSRAVITSALKDLGLGNKDETFKARDWVGSQNFDRWCEYLNWGDWVLDVFDQIDEIDGQNRVEITNQCLKMIRVVSSR